MGSGRRSTCVEVTSMELVKLSSLVVSWIDQTLRLLLSATSVDVLALVKEDVVPGQGLSLLEVVGLRTVHVVV